MPHILRIILTVLEISKNIKKTHVTIITTAPLSQRIKRFEMWGLRGRTLGSNLPEAKMNLSLIWTKSKLKFVSIFFFNYTEAKMLETANQKSILHLLGKDPEVLKLHCTSV